MAGTWLLQGSHRARLRRGDIQGLVALFSEDIEWIGPAEGLPTAGTYRGREAVAGFFQKLAEAAEFSSFEPRVFWAQGDRVVVLGSDTGRTKTTNRTFTSEWAMAFTSPLRSE